MSDTCTAPGGCHRPVEEAGLCAGHRKAKQRHPNRELSELRPKRQGAWVVLLEAALTLCELRPTDDDGWRKARARLRMAAIRYARRQRR